LRLAVEVLNESDRIVSPRFAVVWPAATAEGSDFEEQSLVVLSAGSVDRSPVASIGSPGFFDRFLGGGGGWEPPEFREDVSWAGVDNRHFVGAILPEAAPRPIVVFEALVHNEVGAAVLAFDPVELPPGQGTQRDLRGYLGPKRERDLSAVDSQLTLAINRGYRWVAPLTGFFSWLLVAFYGVIPNYGVVIILLTIMVRVVTIPIMSRQMRSMERMKELQPKLKEIQAKFSDDKAKQSEQTMKLYRETGVNPLGGYLPMLLQFPVFIGLFYALQSSIELRQAPFFGWITDLSVPEALFVLPGVDLPVRLLPIVMGASMVLQQKVTPTSVDPSQATMMLVMMPLMMTVLFYQFPSGLVLYWLVSNLLGIGHQMWVGKRMRKKAT